MAKEEAEANTLLQRELTELNEHREIDRYLLSIGKVILNLETKLERLETANEKLIDALEQSEETTSTEEFQFTLDEDAELTDEVIDKLSQLKLLKEEEEKRKIKPSRQSQRLEEGLQQVQEQIRHLQSPSRGMETGISRIWSQPCIHSNN